MSENIIFDPEFVEGDVKEYEHWKLVVSFRQHTLGSYIIFAKRKVERFSDLTAAELTQLVQIMKEIEKAITNLFQPVRFNYLQLGNTFSNVHFHGIPRYTEVKRFMEREWNDDGKGSPKLTYQYEDKQFISLLKSVVLKEL